LRLNHNSLSDQRVRIINEDAFQWVEKEHKVYDVVILDFPDPTTYGVGKLFSTVFYSRIRKMISPHGALIVQSTSPLVSNLSFWSIRQTLISVGFSTLPLRVYLPSFGDWGFVLAKFSPFKLGFQIPEAVRLECLQKTQLELLTQFPVDTRVRFSSINSLNSQSLVHQYLEEASRFD
jgi:spermidine synthase